MATLYAEAHSSKTGDESGAKKHLAQNNRGGVQPLRKVLQGPEAHFSDPRSTARGDHLLNSTKNNVTHCMRGDSATLVSKGVTISNEMGVTDRQTVIILIRLLLESEKRSMPLPVASNRTKHSSGIVLVCGNTRLYTAAKKKEEFQDY